MRILVTVAILFWVTLVLSAPNPLKAKLAPTKRSVKVSEDIDTSVSYSNPLEPRKHNCYGTKPISCVKIYAEIDWVCSQVASKSYQLGVPMKGTRRVFRVFNGGLVFWEVVPRDMYKELYFTVEDCKREFRFIQDKCAVGSPGSPSRVTYSGWTVHPSGLVTVQMFN